jgi:hypothetical protein
VCWAEAPTRAAMELQSGIDRCLVTHAFGRVAPAMSGRLFPGKVRQSDNIPAGSL